jgi:hypothetical protein
MSVSGFLFTVLAASCIAGLTAMHFFLRYLRLNHSATWQHLGSPSLVMNNNIGNNLTVLRWLWKREYLELEDPRLTRFAQSIIVFQVFYLVLFVVVLLYAGPAHTK